MQPSKTDLANQRLNDFWETCVRQEQLVVDVGESRRGQIDGRWQVHGPVDVAEAPAATLVPSGLELRARIVLRTQLCAEQGRLVCRIERRTEWDYWPEL